MSATLSTVMTVLLTNARTMRLLRTVRTVVRLSQIAHSVGNENPNSAASAGVFAAERKMNTNGTMKTTTDARIATGPRTVARERFLIARTPDGRAAARAGPRSR